MVDWARFERAASCLQSRRSSSWSTSPTILVIDKPYINFIIILLYWIRWSINIKVTSNEVWFSKLKIIDYFCFQNSDRLWSLSRAWNWCHRRYPFWNSQIWPISFQMMTAWRLCISINPYALRNNLNWSRLSAHNHTLSSPPPDPTHRCRKWTYPHSMNILCYERTTSNRGWGESSKQSM